MTNRPRTLRVRGFFNLKMDEQTTPRTTTTMYATVSIEVEHPADWDTDRIAEALDGADYSFTLDASAEGGAKIVDTDWEDTSSTSNF